MTSLVDRSTALPEPRCPVSGADPQRPPAPGPVDPAAAQEFLEQFQAETSPAMTLERRLRQVAAEIEHTGT